MKALLDKEYSKGTLTCFQTSLKHRQDFLKWKYSIAEINIKRVDHAFIMECEFYLRSECKYANNSAVKNIRTLARLSAIAWPTDG